MKQGTKVQVALIGKTTYKDQYDMEHKASEELEIRELTVTHSKPYFYYGQRAGDVYYASDKDGRRYRITPQTDFGPGQKAWICEKERDTTRRLWYENYHPWQEPLIKHWSKKK